MLQSVHLYNLFERGKETRNKHFFQAAKAAQKHKNCPGSYRFPPGNLHDFNF